LQNFPKLRALKLQGFALDAVPESLSSMQNLTELYLEDSNITLTPTAAQALSGLENLEHIDLDGNPLNLTPDFSNMQRLNSVFLSNTELSEFPTSLLGLPEIETIDLSDNLITHLPSELFEAPAFITEALDLAGNPLSEASLNQAHTYFSQTGIDMNISFDDLDPVAVDIVEPEQ
jgi:Leucine-rich repeat (LRR) protein